MNQKQTNSAEKLTVTQDLTGSRLVIKAESLFLFQKKNTKVKLVCSYNNSQMTTSYLYVRLRANVSRSGSAEDLQFELLTKKYPSVVPTRSRIWLTRAEGWLQYQGSLESLAWRAAARCRRVTSSLRISSILAGSETHKCEELREVHMKMKQLKLRLSMTSLA